MYLWIFSVIQTKGKWNQRGGSIRGLLSTLLRLKKLFGWVVKRFRLIRKKSSCHDSTSKYFYICMFPSLLFNPAFWLTCMNYVKEPHGEVDKLHYCSQNSGSITRSQFQIQSCFHSSETSKLRTQLAGGGQCVTCIIKLQNTQRVL